MNYPAETYLQILERKTRLIDISNSLQKKINILWNDIKDGKFISSQFLTEEKQYPLYPDNFSLISSLLPFDIKKIFHSSLDETEKLIELLTEDEVINLKSKLDKIPTQAIEIDYFFQELYHGTSKYEIYNLEKNTSFYKDNTYSNYVYSTLGVELEDILKDQSILFNIVLYIYINKSISSAIDLYDKTLENIISLNIITTNDIHEDFTSYINSIERSFVESIIKFIFRYTYDTDLLSNDLLERLYQDLRKKILSIKDIFKTFITYKDSLIYDSVSDCNNLLINQMTKKILFNMLSNETLIFNNKEVAYNIKQYIEKPLFSSLSNNYSYISMREYLFLNYYYKSWPKKFLNVLQIIVKNYVINKIKTINNNLFDPYELNSYLKSLSDSIYFSNFKNILESYITKDFIELTYGEYEINNFTLKLNLLELFDSFISSDNNLFENYINDIFSSFYTSMEKHGNIEHNFDFFKNRDLIYIYFKIFFRKSILNDEVFTELISKFNTEFLTSIRNYITINFNDVRMKNKITQTLKLYINDIHQFIENIYTSSITEKILIEHLSYYLN